MATVSLKGNPINTIGKLPKVGKKAPKFTLIKNDLSKVKLSDFKADSNPAAFEDSHSAIKYSYLWTVNSEDLGDKVDEETKSNVEKEIENVKTALKSDDVDTIKTATEALTAASHKLAELMYAQAAKNNPDDGANPSGGDAGGGAKKDDKGDDDVVDADFEEVK